MPYNTIMHKLKTQNCQLKGREFPIEHNACENCKWQLGYANSELFLA